VVSQSRLARILRNRRRDSPVLLQPSKKVSASIRPLLIHRFDLAGYFQMRHEVVKAEWITDDSQWEITVQPADGPLFVDRCDVFINAGGVLNAWKWPEIKGLHSFRGALCHTARWPEGLDLKGKKVAIVGSGSSGIQLLATAQPEAEKIYHWISELSLDARLDGREQVAFAKSLGSPTWITAAFAQKYAGPGGKNFEYSEEQKKQFAENPRESLKYRKMIESELNLRFRFLIKGTPEQAAALEVSPWSTPTRRSSLCRLNFSLPSRTWRIAYSTIND
jgi:hypothetical protein